MWPDAVGFGTGGWASIQVAAAEPHLRDVGEDADEHVRAVAVGVAFAAGRGQGIVGFYH